MEKVGRDVDWTGTGLGASCSMKELGGLWKALSCGVGGTDGHSILDVGAEGNWDCKGEVPEEADLSPLSHSISPWPKSRHNYALRKHSQIVVSRFKWKLIQYLEETKVNEVERRQYLTGRTEIHFGNQISCELTPMRHQGKST